MYQNYPLALRQKFDTCVYHKKHNEIANSYPESLKIKI